MKWRVLNFLSPSPSSPSPIICIPVSWSKPPLNFFKLNFDGSRDSSGCASFEFIIRNNEGSPLLVGGRALPFKSFILMA